MNLRNGKKEEMMKAKIILALFLLLIGLGDINEHYLVCAAADAELLPISYTDKEIGKDKKADKELQPISYTDEEIGKSKEVKPEKAKPADSHQAVCR